MTDYSEVKSAAEHAKCGGFKAPCAYEEDRGYGGAEIAYLDFAEKATPDVVLALISEIEACASRLHEVSTACATAEQERDQLFGETEQLKAENERLTHRCGMYGLELTNEVERRIKAERERDQLKVELECARGDFRTLEQIAEKNGKDAERYRWLRQNEFDIGSFHEVQEFNAKAWFEHFTDESIDEAIALEEDFAKENGR